MTMMRRTLLSLCLLSLFACALPVAPPTATFDAAVAHHLGDDFNGVVFQQSSHNAAPLVRAHGVANVEKKLAMTDSTPFQIGSISKWLTAVAVLRLVDQGQLALDAPIAGYLPELPAHTAAITLRQLMSNSAGIPNGVMQEFKKDPGIADLPLSHLAAAQRFATGPLMFAPGSSWEYSPTTWVVVAAVIERVTGKPYGEVMTQQVFAPAKAHATAVPVLPFKDMAGAAIAYKSGQGKNLRDTNLPPHVRYVAASGIIYSTAADLARLAHTVYETDLLSAAARAELSRVMVASENYALGGRVLKKQLGGRERVLAWETGASGGYKSILAYVPGERKTVIILNNTSMDQSKLASAAEAMLQGMY
jgi:D-alanyl-D-alanine carboxypeptidase